MFPWFFGYYISKISLHNFRDELKASQTGVRPRMICPGRMAPYLFELQPELHSGRVASTEPRSQPRIIMAIRGGAWWLSGCGSLAFVAAKVLALGWHSHFCFVFWGWGDDLSLRLFQRLGVPLSFHGQFGFRRMTGGCAEKTALDYFIELGTNYASVCCVMPQRTLL